ncbi:MAG: hypothetical protein AVDCRST_MAG08-3889 [uncultured Acetobacteraceae bacterium]|uniref:Uncharacterized protein n=1 Tax=uncultured Acetobacteraceae bacterium TaxID=169975 RepID=A0A6J4JMK5_9PROT|nr:MAG: hypothetical protein AVDCRST_MAG08-3889 [uncultured Acetobacteraceae bacterium]
MPALVLDLPSAIASPPRRPSSQREPARTRRASTPRSDVRFQGPGRELSRRAARRRRQMHPANGWGRGAWTSVIKL